MKRVFALSVVCALMAACESETDTSTSFPDISDYEYIDLSADDASSNVSAAMSGVGSSSSGDDAGLLGDESAASSALALAQSIASEYLASSSRSARAETQTGSVSCEDGGTLSIEVNGGLTEAGDWVQAYFNSCLEDGVLTTGGLRILLNTDSSILESDSSATYQSLSVTYDGLTATLNGDLRMGWERSGTQVTNAISSSTLNMVSSEDGDTVISDLSIIQVSDTSALSTTLEMNYGIASDELDGRVEFETVQALSYSDLADYPDTGILKLSGANDSSVTLNADTGDVDTVMLTVDTASGATSETVTWESIADSNLTSLIEG